MRWGDSRRTPLAAKSWAWSYWKED